MESSFSNEIRYVFRVENILEIFSVVTSKMVRVRNEIIVLRSENAVEK